LVTGGFDTRGEVRTTEIYDPTTARWTGSGDLVRARYRHTATLLPDGRVLVVGGEEEGDVLASAEIYDPATGRWREAARPATTRTLHTATLLADGQVLVAGGSDDGFNSIAVVERYDPATDKWTTVTSMRTPRLDHTATLLPSGQVIVAGGWDSRSPEVGWLKKTERYDPAGNRWSGGADMSTQHVSHRATLLVDGSILVTGGYDSTGVIAVCERYGQPVSAGATGAPVLAAVTSPLTLGARLEATGQGFVSGPGTSGGNGSQDSSTNFPILRIQSLASGQTRFLPPDPAAPWGDGRFTSLPLTGLAAGHAAVTVLVGGVASAPRLAYLVAQPTARPTATPSPTLTPPPRPSPSVTATPASSSTPGPTAGPRRPIYLPVARRR